MFPPAPQPRQYYYSVMSHKIDLLSVVPPTDSTILLHTTDAIIYSHPALLAKINQGTYILFDASALAINLYYIYYYICYCIDNYDYNTITAPPSAVLQSSSPALHRLECNRTSRRHCISGMQPYRNTRYRSDRIRCSSLRRSLCI